MNPRPFLFSVCATLSATGTLVSCASPTYAQDAKPAEKPAEKPTPVAQASPAAKSAQKPASPAQKPAASPAAKPAQKPAAKVTPEFAAQKLGVKITLTDGQQTAVRTRKELGFRLAPQSHDGAVAFEVDKAALKNALEHIAPAFHAEAEGATPVVVKGHVQIKPGTQARALNVPTTAETITQKVAANPGETKFAVSLEKHPSPLTAEKLKGITGVLATFSTQTSADPKRNHNVALAVSRIDSTLLSPGETFSLNGAVGERTQKTGFLTAHVFVDAKIVDGIGGGVSQVTGTLFNAAARAGLPILEVHPHSRPVAYLPVGYDATVAFGEEDLKFKNNTQAPVYIAYSFANRKLSAQIWGAKKPGVQYVIRPRVQNLGPGKINVQTYRITKQNGKVVNKEKLLTHSYRWDPTKKQ